MTILLRSFLIGVCLIAALAATAQTDHGDWDTYVLYIKNRPVSVMVDLGFGQSPEARQRPNAIIVSVPLVKVQEDGLPVFSELKKLDSLETALIDGLREKLSAVYTGRHTSNGKRDFYFYSNDTLNARLHVAELLTPFSPYRAHVLVAADKDLSNYLNVLYPTQVELQRIYNRRMIMQLRNAGDALTAPRKITHFIFFKTEKDRKSFALTVQDNRFTIEHFSDEKGVKERPYSLEISRADKVDEDSIEDVSLYLWELALKYGAKYDGWETFPVTTP